MPNPKQLDEDREIEKRLTEIRDLLVLSLRQSGVPAGTIGKVLGISAKTVMNRYPMKGAKAEEAETETKGSSEAAPQTNQGRP